MLNSSCAAWQTARFLLVRDARLLQWKSLAGAVRPLIWMQDGEQIVQLLQFVAFTQGEGSIDLVGCRAHTMSVDIASKVEINPLTAPMQCAQVAVIIAIFESGSRSIE